MMEKYAGFLQFEGGTYTSIKNKKRFIKEKIVDELNDPWLQLEKSRAHGFYFNEL